MTHSKLAGIYSLSRNMTMDLAKHAPSSIESLEELHAWLTSTHSVECEPVKADQWQRVLTPQERLLAEQKLNRWLVKPTDGIFARMTPITQGEPMLEKYFSAPKTLRHLRGGISGPHIDGFAENLEHEGYAPASAVRYIRAAAHLG
jgi:hypothetical protein